MKNVAGEVKPPQTPSVVLLKRGSGSRKRSLCVCVGGGIDRPLQSTSKRARRVRGRCEQAAPPPRPPLTAEPRAAEEPPGQPRRADGRRREPMGAPGGGAVRPKGRDFPRGRSAPGESGAGGDGGRACKRGRVGVSCYRRAGAGSCGRLPCLLPPPSLRHDAGNRQAAHRGDTGGQPAGEARATVRGEGKSRAGRPQAWRRGRRRCPPRPRWEP